MMNTTHRSNDDTHPRAVTNIIDSQRLLEGGGFPVRRPYPTAQLSYVDPFLLFDHMGPVDWPPNEAIGAPEHPHRGFETVTYMLEGYMEHKDSGGHSGIIGPGDVQWMTAGAGVVHSELPEAEFKHTGGTMNGIQIWVNLPAKDKMMTPRYQDIPAAQIPEARSEDGLTNVRVIAGSAMGKSAVIDTRIPITYLHYVIAPGGRAEQAIPPGHNAMVYIISGDVLLGDERKKASEAQLALLGDGNTLALAVDPYADASASLLILAGQPINEPVARYGPFVMNTKQEIHQAFEDFQSGRFGKI